MVIVYRGGENGKHGIFLFSFIRFSVNLIWASGVNGLALSLQNC